MAAATSTATATVATSSSSSSSSLSSVSSAAASPKVCAVCASSTGLKCCGRCRDVWYCGRDHQLAHHPTHKSTCTPPRSLEHVVIEIRELFVQHLVEKVIDFRVVETQVTSKPSPQLAPCDEWHGMFDVDVCFNYARRVFVIDVGF